MKRVIKPTLHSTLFNLTVAISIFKLFFFSLSQGEGEEIQSALAAWTGQRTVPNVFTGGKHIGGCDSGCIFVDQALLKTMEVCTQFVLILSVLVVAALTEKHQQGQLVPFLLMLV